MVRQTKRFKKGLNKKVLSAILAASMIMTSSSFAMAAPNAEPLTEEPVVETQELEDANAGVAALSEDPQGAEEIGNNAKAAATFDDFKASLELDGVIYDVNVEDGNPNTNPDAREFEYKGGMK